MRRFNYEENDEYRDDVDKFFNEEPQDDVTDEQLKAIMEEEMAMEQMQVNFVYRDLNHRVLRIAIRSCEKSFWWWFCSQNTKLKMIEKAFRYLKKLEEE
jgi:uncharacterized protein YpuA (DUF1002 family)